MSNVINVDFTVNNNRGFSFDEAQSQEETYARYIDYPERLEVGQRIHCILFGGKNGTIIGIHGEQQPETVKKMTALGILSGGNAEIDIAWDTGYEGHGGFSYRTPEAIVRGVQWEMLSGYRDVGEAIAESEAHVSAELAKEEAGKVAFNKGKDKVRIDYPYLTEDDGTDRNIIQKNLRAILKEKFPGTKFKVTKDSYSARRVNWTDGPTTRAVMQVTNLFEEGSFNGMEDVYEYNASPFNSVFGGCQYIFESRDLSDKLIAKAIDEVWEAHSIDFEGFEKPDFKMYREGGLRDIYSESWGRNFSEVLWDHLRTI